MLRPTPRRMTRRRHASAEVLRTTVLLKARGPFGCGHRGEVAGSSGRVASKSGRAEGDVARQRQEGEIWQEEYLCNRQPSPGARERHSLIQLAVRFVRFHHQSSPPTWTTFDGHLPTSPGLSIIGIYLSRTSTSPPSFRLQAPDSQGSSELTCVHLRHRPALQRGR